LEALMKNLRVRQISQAAVVLLSACALGPLRPDLLARAPELKGFGDVQVLITTRSPQAQRWFTQGVLQAYAFNEREAVRMFKAALAQDPSCSLCAWGVAWQLGPNINNSSRDQVPEALRYVDLALRSAALPAGATARERAWIDALALRYGHSSQAQAARDSARDTAPLLAERCGPDAADDPDDKVDPLDLAYAERLRALLVGTPNDPELISLWAEAEMVATRGRWWTTGSDQAAGRIAEVTQTLERALALQPQHLGMNHYLIHAVDHVSVATRAVAAADRLAALAPGSPHLVHMPSHTYSHVGRYADAAKANETAVAADMVLLDAQKAQGFEVSKDWRGHNQSFLVFSALMQGRGDVALAAAREIAGRAAKAEHVFGEYQRSLPLLVLLRLERWDAVLAEPVPDSTHGLADALGEQARGVAFARTGKPARGREALVKAEAGAAKVAKTFAGKKYFDQLLSGMANAGPSRLRAEIALAEGRLDDALAQQAQTVAFSQRADDAEPPMLGASAREVLAQMQGRAGQHAQAEQTLRTDLAQQPGNGWALRGLVQALIAQGKTDAAKPLRTQWGQAWAEADAALLSTQQ
jgi:hypothetical protein